MTTIGRFVSLEEKSNSYIFSGISNIEEGQCIRRGSSTWKVSKRRWMRPPLVSLILISMDGTWPSEGDEVELIIDPLEQNDSEETVTIISSLIVEPNKFIVWVLNNTVPNIGSSIISINDSWKVVSWKVVSHCSYIGSSNNLGTPILVSGDGFIQPGMKLGILKENKMKTESIVPESINKKSDSIPSPSMKSEAKKTKNQKASK